MSFLFPTILTIGLPLAALPILIHLLNPRRQRRIRWAAMQFLEESQRRNRTWVLLRQFLLLAVRTAAIALVALLLAGLVLQDSWARMFGAGESHHVVLVDDSFSMSDRDGDVAAFDRAKQVVRRIVEGANRQGDVRRLTLLKFSEAARLAAGSEPAIYRQVIGDALRSRLESMLAKLSVSETAVGIGEALRGVGRLPQLAGTESQVLHVVSDFRQRNFAEASELRESLIELNDDFAHVHLVQCVRDQRPNLAITSLEADAGLRAAGVESWMHVAVANFGTQTARDVTLRLEQDGTTLPAIVMPDIPPGDEVGHRFRIRFNGVGSHRLVASLEVDAVEVDSRRYFACRLPAAVPILLVDGSPAARDAFYLSKALEPGGQTHTGWQPRIEPPEFLRDADNLDQFAAIFLLDVGRLDAAAVEQLEKYVLRGGGLAFFLGERVERQFYNERLYRDGDGLFPLPLKLPTQLLDSRGEQVPDVAVGDSELFRALAGERNSFLPLLMVDYYYATPLASPLPKGEGTGGGPPAPDDVRVLATLRNGAPLVVERAVGKGRVVAHLTKLSPTETALGPWSNWSVNPVFPVLANELCSYLSMRAESTWLRAVGEELAVTVDENDAASGQLSPQWRFVIPDRTLGRNELPIEASQLDGTLSATLSELTTSGVYELRIPTAGGDELSRLYAVNVDAAEGDLAIASREEIERLLEGARFEFHYADQLDAGEQRIAGFRMSGPLLALIVGLLLVEQLLGCAASYHAPVVKGRGR